MPELNLWVNKRKITVHCPACGKINFFKPKSFGVMWERWYRCKSCNLDILFEDNQIKMIMEDTIDND